MPSLPISMKSVYSLMFTICISGSHTMHLGFPPYFSILATQSPKVLETYKDLAWVGHLRIVFLAELCTARLRQDSHHPWDWFQYSSTPCRRLPWSSAAPRGPKACDRDWCSPLQCRSCTI